MRFDNDRAEDERKRQIITIEWLGTSSKNAAPCFFKIIAYLAPNFTNIKARSTLDRVTKETSTLTMTIAELS